MRQIFFFYFLKLKISKMTDPNEISLDGLTILITGGARRLGKHLVCVFCQKKKKIIIN